MTWLPPRLHFKNRDSLTKSNTTNNVSLKCDVPSVKHETKTNHSSNKSRNKSSLSAAAKKRKKTKTSRKVRTTTTTSSSEPVDLTCGMKVGQWLFCFSTTNKSNGRRSSSMKSDPIITAVVDNRISDNSRSDDKPSTTTTPTEKGCSDEGTTAGTIETADVTTFTHGSSSTSSISTQIARLEEMRAEGVRSDIDLLFRAGGQTNKDLSTGQSSQNENWENESLHLGRVIDQRRQSSEASALTIASQGTKESEQGGQLSKSWSVDSSTQSSTSPERITKVVGLDNLFDSTFTSIPFFAENSPLRTRNPELGGSPNQSKPAATPRNHSDSGAYHITQRIKDGSLEATVPPSVLCTDFGEIRSTPIERYAELHQTHVTTSSRPTITPTDLSTSFDSLMMLSQEILQEDDTLCDYMKNILSDLPQEGNNEFHRAHTNRISRSIPSSSSGCATMSAGSSIEEMDRLIRSRMLDGSDIDSNCYSSSSVTHSSNDGNVTNSTPYQRLDNTVMEDQSPTSSDSNDHFVNLPLELLNNHVVLNRDNDCNRNSDVISVSSIEEILYSDNFGQDDMIALQQHAKSISSNEEESDLPSGPISMLGLFKDVESCNSSVTSFDSIEFLEDDRFDDGKSKGCCSIALNCSISLNDITTIHEEDDDDIAEEVSLSPEEDGDLLMYQNVLPIPLNGELHLRQTTMPGIGTRTLSSVTDDSYVGSTSFDSFSSLSERPAGLYCKAPGWKDRINIDLSHHEDFARGHTLGKPSHQQEFSDESSQNTFESSLVSFTDSNCSYDSFSSDSIKRMTDMLKEETDRRRSKVNNRIAKCRESSDEVTYAIEYVSSLTMGKVND